MAFAQSIADQQIELLPGVLERLQELHTRHTLLLVTKGTPPSSTREAASVRPADFFRAVEVLPEKHEEAYRALVAHHGCEARTTWMIGNSPKSDINPALAAGLNAVFIPHDFTWVLEHESVNHPPAGQHFMELGTFADLLNHF